MPWWADTASPMMHKRPSAEITRPDTETTRPRARLGWRARGNNASTLPWMSASTVRTTAWSAMLFWIWTRSPEKERPARRWWVATPSTTEPSGAFLDKSIVDTATTPEPAVPVADCGCWGGCTSAVGTTAGPAWWSTPAVMFVGVCTSCFERGSKLNSTATKWRLESGGCSSSALPLKSTSRSACSVGSATAVSLVAPKLCTAACGTAGPVTTTCPMRTSPPMFSKGSTTWRSSLQTSTVASEGLNLVNHFSSILVALPGRCISAFHSEGGATLDKSKKKTLSCSGSATERTKSA
mmetsp:Transcript_30473/g.87348  ORF Transcript_30473/g.87348 Transcript_30473/m.87348 type:complete len:295 (-) Transcript_30473:149-1033(-)